MLYHPAPYAVSSPGAVCCITQPCMLDHPASYAVSPSSICCITPSCCICELRVLYLFERTRLLPLDNEESAG